MTHHESAGQDNFWKMGGGWISRLVAWGMLAAAGLCFLLFFLILYRGEPWAYIIYAENPYAHFFGGISFALAWYYFHKGFRENCTAWVRILGKTFLLVFSLGVSFLAGEIGLRWMLTSRQEANSLENLKKLKNSNVHQSIRSDHPLALIIQPSEYPSVIYELQSNLDMDFGGKRLRTNNDGMRESRNYLRESLPNTVRIIGVGDSGMFGWNVEQDFDYMGVLEKRLNKQAGESTYEVLNLAVPGYNSQIESEVLRLKGVSYKPDIVIVGWCENDGQLPFFLLENEDFSRRDVSFLHMLLFRRDDYRQIASGATIKNLRDFNREKVDPNILNGTEAAGLEKAFAEIKQLSEENDFRVLIFGPIGKGVRALLNKVGLPYYNTYEKIDASAYPDEWAVHFMHPSAEGHDVLARNLEKELRERGWIPANP
jgi:lysophospholipase L1-like esterase